MASRWRVWDNEAHINITSRSGSMMSWPVKHTVGRGNLHLLAKKVSLDLPQLDTIQGSPTSRKKLPPRGMGRADILRNRLSRQNEGKKPGIKTTGNSNSIDKLEDNSNSKKTDVVIRKLPLNITQKEVNALLDPYDSSVLTCVLVKEGDTVTAHLKMDNHGACEWIISSLHGAEIYGSDYKIECSST